MKYCCFCKEQLYDDANFCIKCGKKLGHVCGSCGNPYVEGDIYCTNCGNKLIGNSEGKSNKEEKKTSFNLDKVIRVLREKLPNIQNLRMFNRNTIIVVLMTLIVLVLIVESTESLQHKNANIATQVEQREKAPQSTQPVQKDKAPQSTQPVQKDKAPQSTQPVQKDKITTNRVFIQNIDEFSVSTFIDKNSIKRNNNGWVTFSFIISDSKIRCDRVEEVAVDPNKKIDEIYTGTVNMTFWDDGMKVTTVVNKIFSVSEMRRRDGRITDARVAAAYKAIEWDKENAYTK